MSDRKGRIILVEEIEAMSPQERSDCIDAGIVRSIDTLEPAFRERVLARA